MRSIPILTVRRGAAGFSPRGRSRARNVVTLLCAVALLAPPARAASPRELIQHGNEHHAAGRYGEALEAYRKAAEASHGAFDAELLHNQAAAQFKLGRIDEARELWVRALSLKDARFEAQARYNLGNCDYAAALRGLESGNAQGILEALDRATQQYRDALHLDPGVENARANLELAYQLKKKLEEQATSQPQTQRSASQENQPNQQDQSTQPSEQEREPKDQERPSSSTQPSSQPQQQPPPPSTQPEEPPPQTQPDNAQTQPQQEPARQERRGEEQPLPTIEMTRDQAERLMQKIRDLEKARRRMLLQREAARQKPVDRDW